MESSHREDIQKDCAGAEIITECKNNQQGITVYISYLTETIEKCDALCEHEIYFFTL